MSISEMTYRHGERCMYKKYQNPYRDRDVFSFGGVSSIDFEIWVMGGVFLDKPEKDIQFETVQGRNGELIIDNGRWKNLSITYQCGIMWNALSLYEEFVSKLLAQSGYQRLYDSFHPETYRMAIIKDPIKAQMNGKNRPGAFDVTFYCKPQRFLQDGDHSVSFSESSVLNNMYGYPAKPLITVYGSGVGNLWVGDTLVEIKSMTDQITLDCDMCNAYRKVGDGATENLNSSIYTPQFPTLEPGENAISWDGNIEHVEIIPRWWVL